jgi:hypothetical protein
MTKIFLKNMKYKLIIIALICVSSVFANPNDRTRWVKIGEGTYDYGFIFPYKMKFHVPYGVRNIQDIKRGVIPMKFDLKWLPLEFTKEKVEMMFSKQFEEYYSDKESFKLSHNIINQFLNKLPSIVKHDKWVFTYYPDEGTQLFIDDKKIHHLVGSELNRALYQSWLNKNPVLTANLFKRLLKIQK